MSSLLLGREFLSDYDVARYPEEVAGCHGDYVCLLRKEAPVVAFLFYLAGGGRWDSYSRGMFERYLWEAGWSSERVVRSLLDATGRLASSNACRSVARDILQILRRLYPELVPRAPGPGDIGDYYCLPGSAVVVENTLTGTERCFEYGRWPCGALVCVCH